MTVLIRQVIAYLTSVDLHRQLRSVMIHTLLPERDLLDSMEVTFNAAAFFVTIYS